MQETQEMQVQSLSQEDTLEESMKTHSSILAWRIPWTEEPGMQQSMEAQREGHDWAGMHAHMSTLEVCQYKVKSIITLDSDFKDLNCLKIINDGILYLSFCLATTRERVTIQPR